MPKILLTNDDGVRRPGLWSLYYALQHLGDVTIVAPESMRSATGMSLTLHKPLRLRQVIHNGERAYSVSGTPSDCIILGIRRILRDREPDIVVSGINEGENASSQAIYGSGTVAAAIRAAILGIPAIAFSQALPEKGGISGRQLKAMMGEAAKVAAEIVGWVMENGLPEGVDYLNVNFPEKLSSTTPIRITRVLKARYVEMVLERRDPKNKPYYWIYGELFPREKFTVDSDVHSLFVEGTISISPMKVDSSAGVEPAKLAGLVERINRGRTAWP
ncbi:MAG: 5'/3'-nucleotidase SurE [Nitrososphaerota archaeon]